MTNDKTQESARIAAAREWHLKNTSVPPYANSPFVAAFLAGCEYERAADEAGSPLDLLEALERIRRMASGAFDQLPLNIATGHLGNIYQEADAVISAHEERARSRASAPPPVADDEVKDAMVEGYLPDREVETLVAAWRITVPGDLRDSYDSFIRTVRANAAFNARVSAPVEDVLTAAHEDEQ